MSRTSLTLLSYHTNNNIPAGDLSGIISRIMLFNSIEFLIFLPIVFLLYWFIFKRLKWQNLFVVIASYIFYGWWDWRFLILIALTTLFSYISGQLIAHFEGQRKRQMGVSAANIILNLAILGTFKYYNFFAENFATLLHSFGVETDWVMLDILLPVGISFYTFQALSYSIDVYQKKLPACRDIIAFFAYISFFPQLVAGPIERSTNLLPQFYHPRTFDYAQAVDGCRQILWGFFKKMVIADNAAYIVNSIFSDISFYNPSALLIGAILFTFQIYGDFSGYSDIAIGTAKLFGIKLMRNFNVPYFSRDIAEFWRRWHISLNTWFRDYIYIPLGGSRTSTLKVVRNTLIIFLTSGLWHGANWTFIAWGGYHALLFIPLLLNKKNRNHTNIVAEKTFLPSVKEQFQMLLTFVLVMIGWVIFRSANIGQAWSYLQKMLDITHYTLPNIRGLMLLNLLEIIIAIFFLLSVEWYNRKKEIVLSWNICKLLRWSLYIIISIWAIVSYTKGQTFIYFQF